MTTIKEFMTAWEEKEDATGARQAFTELLTHLNTLDHTHLTFNARPGVSYSLRPCHTAQTTRSLFAMVDVIDDDPDQRWLSVCFYGDMVTDPEEMGDLIPGGLLGEDGYCFDLYTYDRYEIAYLKERLTQAHQKAAE